uniref:NADH-ubiquinone oxidoreductase chain 6 n=1 Tax=Scutellaria tsinyunensis TaxID=1862659 RepID=A0A8A6L2U4_9LAMI|nr:NADH dehydrogenase subunit 6 [Scutellaria barbata]YP_010426605.1 NADH dehydrogenase subunit 6 [Scutellaria franchetiana]QTI91142.1 NADH dehydrogenase subunit 6 [Scutellaria tsinyunensis]USM11275.1 NADH dehydrogenase subunit 6 [Scutellaria barbata]USM11324.1 NADH dehydrogenase subunit 6 [Scutellaria franchetiana]
MILSVLSSPALVSGLMVVRAKNPVHSVFFPIPVFRNTSGLLLFLGLDFFAMIFPVVHIGAIAVSFLFVVMMFNIQIAEIHEEVLRYLPVSGIIGLIFWWEMFFILDNESIPLLPTQRNTTSLRYTVYAEKVRSWTNLETLGNLLYTYYFVWFLVPSLILLVAMIGAIVLTMHRTTKVKKQDVFRRNAIDSRRTIMRRTTDPSRSTKGKVAQNRGILVQIQFVRRSVKTLPYRNHPGAGCSRGRWGTGLSE